MVNLDLQYLFKRKKGGGETVKMAVPRRRWLLSEGQIIPAIIRTPGRGMSKKKGRHDREIWNVLIANSP